MSPPTLQEDTRRVIASSLITILNSRHAIITVALVAVLGPLISRVFSPLLFILLSPLLIPLALLIYIVLHVLLSHSLDKNHALSTSDTQSSLKAAARPMAFSTPAAWQAVLTKSQWSYTSPHSFPPLLPSYPHLSNALNEILILIVRDFVLSWYTSLSPSPDFPKSVSTSLRESSKSLLLRMETLDLPSLIVRRILPKINAHVDQFRESERALRGMGAERRITQSDELDLLLASRYAGRGGRLHPAVDNLSSMHTRPFEEAHLRRLVDRILPLLLPSSEAQSRTVHIAAREILTCAVLAPVVDMFTDPDFYNRMIDQFAGAAIRQQKLVSRVRHLLETQSLATKGLSLPTGLFPRNHVGNSETITSRTGARHFDSFLRSISRCDSLLDARRLKSDVLAEIRKTRVLLDAHPNDDIIRGERAENVVAYLDRLYTAKRKVEKRIIVLGGGADDSTRSLPHGQQPSNTSQISLRDVLANPNAISYFMEFMDRKHRASLVQFWLTVETFKDPLEAVVSDSEDETTPFTPPNRPPASVMTVKEDMQMVYKLYFSEQASKRSPLFAAISPKYVDAIRSFVIDSQSVHDGSYDATLLASSKRIRQVVLRAQKQVEQDMNDDFTEFQRSRLWFHVVDESLPSQIQQRTHASPSKRGSVRQTQSSTFPPRPALTAFRDPSDTVRSRIYPTFILPSSLSTTPTVSTFQQDTQSPGASSSRTRPRVRSFGSEVIRPQGLTSPSPSLANSIESLPSPRSRPFNNSLDFLLAPSHDDTSPSAASDGRAPLFDDPDLVREETANVDRIEAIQAALTDIIADDKRQDEQPQSPADRPRRQPLVQDPFAHHSDFGYPLSPLESPYLDETSPLPSDSQFREPLPSSTGIFSDLDTPSDEIPPSSHRRRESGGHGEGEDERANVHIAAPGELQLSHDIARLTDKINKLQSQEVLLEALTRKAELTGDVQELKLLARSKASLARELREMTFQRTQYEEQEKENRLIPGRTGIYIASSVAGQDDAGKQVVRYIVEVQQMSPEHKITSGWLVSRRYNEFFVMHQRLKERYALVKNLDFPGKRLVTSLSSTFIDSRRVALERYLQSLVAIPIVCESEELRAFLSRQSNFTETGHVIVPKAPLPIMFPGHEIVRTMYRSVAESIDDMFFGPSMLDVMIQRLSRQAAEFAGIVGSGVHDEDLIANAVKSPDETLLHLPGDLKALGGEASASSFTAPICDLVLSVFELDEKKNWLRRQAVVVILQQVLGGTIERKLRDLIKTFVDEMRILSYIRSFRDSLWPGGKLRPASVPRTAEEKLKTRDDANGKLSALIPDLAANMIGRSNARRGARRMFAVLQNKRLNQHIVYTVLDELFDALFPDAPPLIPTS